MQKTDILMQLLRFELCDATVPEETVARLRRDRDGALAAWLYTVSNSHDLSHLVADAMLRLDVLTDGETAEKFKKDRYTAVYRVSMLEREFARVCNFLEERGIDFLPLKGSVLRSAYPAPWMRTSCAIDLLVREDAWDSAVGMIAKAFSCRIGDPNSHDVSLYFPSGVHLELHFTTVENNRAGNANAVLSEIWSMAHPVSDGSHRYELSDAAFYLYHIAHMAKHFENGGCGVRPFMDLWLLNHRWKKDAEGREELLSRAGLSLFAEKSERLSDVWFDGGDSDDLTDRLAQFVLSGGTYGTVQNRIAVGQSKTGGKFAYILSRAFLPYSSMKNRYPVLKKHPWLLPAAWVHRWFYLLFGGGMRRTIGELRANRNLSQEQADAASALLSELGL